MAKVKGKSKTENEETEEVDDEEVDDEEDEQVDDDEESEEDDESEDDEDDEEEDDADRQALIDENNRLKREAAERSKADRQARRSKAEKEGKWKQLAEEETERADKAEEELRTLKRRGNVEKVAARLNMEDPEDAYRFLEEDDMDDERLTERALKRLRERRPALFKTKRRTGADLDNEDDESDDEVPAGTGEGFERLRRVKRKT